jgi:hypothetical protein
MIEDIILSQDKRGINALKKAVPPNFCERAAHFLHDNAERVLVATGFYVDGHCETDGPVGALMLAQALDNLGSEVTLVSDRYCVDVLRKMKIPFPLHDFPMTGSVQSKAFSEHLISHIDPTVLVSIERCGRAADGQYYNMQGRDISPHTAKIDSLFTFPRTVGIGDGGNEIGMGNVYELVKKEIPYGEKIASIVKTTHLVISSVSNWGTYGVLTSLSQITGEELLTPEDPLLTRVVKAGAIDSFSKTHKLLVDGYGVEATRSIISQLHEHISSSSDDHLSDR